MNRPHRLNRSAPSFCAGAASGRRGLGASRAQARRPACRRAGRQRFLCLVPAAGRGQRPSADILAKTLSLDNPGNRPIPTNHWWTDLLVTKQFAGQTLGLPADGQGGRAGRERLLPHQVERRGQRPGQRLPAGGPRRGLPPHRHAGRGSWGDWTVTFREAESAGKILGRDAGPGPALCLAGVPRRVAARSPSRRTRRRFDAAGQPVTLPTQADQIGITYGGRSYGLFAPDGTQVSQTADGGLASVHRPGSSIWSSARSPSRGPGLFRQVCLCRPPRQPHDLDLRPRSRHRSRPTGI